MKRSTARAALVAIGALAALLAAPGAARADAIDGQWCAADGRHFTIDGADIVTPAGTQTKGDYSRHAFTYQVPAGEPDAGAAVSMLLMNETTVHLWIGQAPARGAPPMEVWHRCSPSVRLEIPAIG